MKSGHPFQKQQAKIFCSFGISEYDLWQKMRTQKRRKSTETFVKQRILIADMYIYQKTAKSSNNLVRQCNFCFKNQQSYFQSSILFLQLTLRNNLTAVSSFFEHAECLKVFQITSKVLIPLKINRIKFSVVSGFSNLLYGEK